MIMRKEGGKSKQITGRQVSELGRFVKQAPFGPINLLTGKRKNANKPNKCPLLIGSASRAYA